MTTRAGIHEHWIVDPLKRTRLDERAEYAPPDIISEGQLTPHASPRVEIDIESIWEKK